MYRFQKIFRSNFLLKPNEDPELNEHLRRRILSNDFVQSAPLTYQPLAVPSNIRILELLPGAIHDRIQCTLHEADLNFDNNVYTAVSYVWSNHEDRLPMECNGKEALVTLNLYSILLRLRHTEHPRQLWVDALCINQAPDPAAL